MGFYSIPGAPIRWQRAGRNGSRYYDTQKHLKLTYGILLTNQHGSAPKYTKPLHLDAVFYFAIPQYAKSLKDPSNSNPKKQSKKEGMPVSITPDLDNCVKFLMDSCNDILWVDDCIVCSMNIKKLYSEKPRTEFTIIEMI